MGFRALGPRDEIRDLTARPTDRRLAVLIGVALAAWSAGAVLGPLCAGAVADAAGDSVAFIATAAVGAILTLCLALSQRPIRRALAVERG